MGDILPLRYVTGLNRFLEEERTVIRDGMELRVIDVFKLLLASNTAT